MQKVPRNDKKAPLSTHRAGHSIQSQNICRGARQQRFPRLRHTARRGHPSSVEMRARPRGDAALWPQLDQNARLINGAVQRQYADQRAQAKRRTHTAARRQAFLSFHAASGRNAGRPRLRQTASPPLPSVAYILRTSPSERARSARSTALGCGGSAYTGRMRLVIVARSGDNARISIAHQTKANTFGQRMPPLRLRQRSSAVGRSRSSPGGTASRVAPYQRVGRRIAPDVGLLAIHTPPPVPASRRVTWAMRALSAPVPASASASACPGGVYRHQPAREYGAPRPRTSGSAEGSSRRRAAPARRWVINRTATSSARYGLL